MLFLIIYGKMDIEIFDGKELLSFYVDDRSKR